MGYYSDIALHVSRSNAAAQPLTWRWTAFTGGRFDMWTDDVTDLARRAVCTDDHWLLVVSGERWYDSYRNVAYILRWKERMCDVISDYPEDYTLTFVRIGEDQDDNEQEYYGNNNEGAISILRQIDYPAELALLLADQTTKNGADTK